MRFWQILITDPATGDIIVPATGQQKGYTRPAQTQSASISGYGSGGQASLPTATYTSLIQGKSLFTPGSTNPAALRFQCDIKTGPQHLPMPGQWIKLSNVSLGEAVNAQSQLQHTNIVVSGGMAAGLPLANPAQAGLLCAGQIRNAFGNWIAGEESIEAYIYSSGSSATSNQFTGSPATLNTVPIPATGNYPANIVFQWNPGQPLITPLVQALQQAFPQYGISGAINPNLVLTGLPETAAFPTLSTFASYLNQKSLSVIGGFAPSLATYMGVQLVLQNNTILVFDGTVLPTPKQILYDDLVGQPTSAEPYVVQAITQMRADIAVGDRVTLPNTPYTQGGGDGGLVPTSASLGDAAAQLKYATGNSGTYICTSVRHVGDSLGSAALDWVTILELRQIPTASQTATQTAAAATTAATTQNTPTNYPSNPASTPTPTSYPIIAKPLTNNYQFFVPGVVS